MNTPRPARRGLTLVETLVTMALAGILLALAAPSVRDMIARQRLRGMQAELVSDLQFARGESLRRGAGSPGVVVQFGGDAGMFCYAVLTAGPAACECTKRPAPICTPKGVREELKIVQVERAAGVDLAASGVSAAASAEAMDLGQIAFVPPLAAAQPADMALDLQSDHGGRLRVVVNATGRPTVCSPDSSHSGVAPC